MGGVCDRWGPRYGAASLNLSTAAASFGEHGGCSSRCRLWYTACKRAQEERVTMQLQPNCLFSCTLILPAFV